jgi:hypothetical protein
MNLPSGGDGGRRVDEREDERTSDVHTTLVFSPYCTLCILLLASTVCSYCMIVSIATLVVCILGMHINILLV